ncbi:hypothetical protein [Moraxella catarrhalis]|uniref:hypothetical protein n=1 Tax=Moraxella catarrhalis TaxID=480 RepID=UPI000EA995ED|nr:hypothetical protein [Moraxella catarrhalis]MPW51692.1 hypothetical protein [Moraxella catarrhalis]RKL84531.1 hypothetical protein D6E01_03290 [Moraxella catarrhalis]RKM02461.1 hypothetical protein D6D58_03220 [Moraxella catarrhalis]RKM48391.1 hypothetical protein D6D75_05395 [Moraxella catarrhalis]RKM52835.1 hypothetical protein D6D93_00400 [Moraxella catarrhalis]
MKLSNIKINEFGVTANTEAGDELYLQLPHTPDSQHAINHEPLDDDDDFVKEVQEICDEYFGKGDRTLARLSYAGGQAYDSYTEEDGVYTTNTGDQFVEHSYADYYNVEVYCKADLV